MISTSEHNMQQESRIKKDSSGSARRTNSDLNGKRSILRKAFLMTEAESLLQLADEILKSYSINGESCQLNAKIIAGLSFKTREVKQKHLEGTKYLNLAIEAFNERDALSGIAENGRPCTTTLKFYVRCCAESALHSYFFLHKKDDDVHPIKI